ncbi:MAG: TRAP transporter small permease [Geminicoccaceae bacterium]|nr:MAG: TRAP transporter small permease [Geminicoccaceae bacterium]
MTTASSPRARGPVRRVLDGLYLASGILGACFILGIAGLITAKVVGRLLGRNIPGSDDLTAWFVAASAFLALAYTFRHGSHIRVTLLVQRFTGRWRRGFELASLVVATLAVGGLAAGLVDLVLDSWRWNDIAQGLLRVPMWIPQSATALGAVILFIALVDDLVTTLRGGEASYLKGDGAADRFDGH